MAIRSASDSIKQLIHLSDELDKVQQKAGGDLTHVFVKALENEQAFEVRPTTAFGKLWQNFKRLLFKDDYSIAKNLSSYADEFKNADTISEQEYVALQKRYGNIEERLNKLAERLETIKTNITTNSGNKNRERLAKITISGVHVEERRLAAFEDKLKKKAEALLSDPNADYAIVLSEFSKYANEAIPQGITREVANKNFAPKIESMMQKLQETIKAYVMGSVEMFDTLDPKERDKTIALLRSIIDATQDIELKAEFEKGIRTYLSNATTTVEKTKQVAATIPLFSADNAYKTLAYVAYDLATKRPSDMLSFGYLLSLAAPTLALHLYNNMVTTLPDISSKKSFVITFLTQVLAKSGAPYVTHQFKRMLG